MRSTLVWPRIIHDRETLKKVTTTAFAKLTDIQSYLPQIVVENTDLLMKIFITYRLNGTSFMNKTSSFLGKRGLMDEGKPVFDVIWNINREIQEDAYTEPHMFHWDFEYGVDGWEKLVQLQRQHPDETIENEDKMTTDAILGDKK
jgi:hypothetical protein